MASSRTQVILASTSPRRKELMGHTGLPFTVMSENVAEESQHQAPVEYCLQIASLKGKAVSQRLQKERANESFFIISADTIVEFQGRIFNKPADKNEAREFLSILSGKTHSVFTAVCFELIQNGVVCHHHFVDESKVAFDVISDDVMERYIATGDSLDKAGAYGIQGGSLSFISKVEGSYSNVVGFPLSRFIREAKVFLGEASWQNLY